jgi:hypothetical protein
MRACLAVSLQAISVAQAYEADIHYSTTYVLARAVGWPEADAQTIASANQAVDENQDTTAALEVDSSPNRSLASGLTSSIHQAEKNLKFHCFSRTRGQPGQISADVLEVISGHFAGVPGHREDPQENARRLIALGVALHCQQDAYAHQDFGGSCGSHSGSCYGHTYQSLLDQVIFGTLKVHLHNPDHPGVSGEQLLQVLEGTVSELAKRRPKASLRPIPGAALVALSEKLRWSGLELPDPVRMNCNRYIAGKWLFEFLDSGSGTKNSPDTLEKVAPEVAVTCGNKLLASATVIRIPAPSYPRLDSDASPYLVRQDGTYQLLRDGGFETFLPSIEAEGIADLRPNYSIHKVRVQLSHWMQLLALPLVVRAAI